jgi:NADH:ubiquinone oxidoreductase subunit 6 (subunit J)
MLQIVSYLGAIASAFLVSLYAMNSNLLGLRQELVQFSAVTAPFLWALGAIFSRSRMWRFETLTELDSLRGSWPWTWTTQ